VVEVQYSNIEEKVLYDRTKFWVDLGFTVVWIFNDKKHANFEGKYKNQQRWSRQPVWWRTFQEFRSNVEIIIQSPKLERIIIEDAEGDEDIVEQKTFYQIEEASYRPRFKKAKFLCKTSPLTKRELIRQLKGESFYDLYMQKVRALKK